LDDNPTLLAACSNASSLLPVYVFDLRKHNTPTLAGARKSGARRTRFLLESLANLRKNLEKKGSGLAIAIGQPQDVLPRLCEGVKTVCVTQGICSEETREEGKVSKQLQNRGAELKRVWGGSLYLPEECGCAPDNVPLLFTSFKNKAESRGRIRDPLDPPKELPPLPKSENEEQRKFVEEALKCMPTLEDLGYEADEAKEALTDDPRAVLPFEGGEDAALQRMQKWMWDDDHLREYFEIRNGMKGEGYSSKFSPWLALGCMSPRRIWKEAQRYEATRAKNKSTYWLIFELTWRDFFMYMGLSQGNKIFLQGGVVNDKTPWKGSMEALQRWKDGRTKDPLVDANMLELKASGFMSNRGRQNVASYLIFDLGVDWRYGAAHFEELLLDYDPCSNWGNWVAAAGLTGQRINKFNTKKQLNDYDPQREYVNHWLNGVKSAPTLADKDITVDRSSGGKKGKSAGKGKDSKAGGKGHKDGPIGGGGSVGQKRRWTQARGEFSEQVLGA